MSGCASVPVFIHALFRTGSTYLWSVYRDTERYWCYCEPFHERLHLGQPRLHLPVTVQRLRHPPLQRPYFAEYDVDAAGRSVGSTKAISYDLGYLEPMEKTPALRRYLDLLVQQAPRRPLFQPCRSTLRIGWLRHTYGGIHVYAIRGPRAQWASYMSFEHGYFMLATLLTLGKCGHRPLVEPLVETLHLPRFDAATLEHEFAFYHDKVLSQISLEVQYAIFYYHWCISWFAAMEHCHVLIDMDHLSQSPAYRQRCEAHLRTLDVGVDLSACAIPAAQPLPLSEATMVTVEDWVERLLREGLGHWLQAVLAGLAGDGRRIALGSGLGRRLCHLLGETAPRRTVGRARSGWWRHP